MRNARSRADRATAWQRGILARRPVKVAVLAQAAKTARIAWKLMTSGERYDPAHQPAREGLAASPYGELHAEPLAAGGQAAAV